VPSMTPADATSEAAARVHPLTRLAERNAPSFAAALDLLLAGLDVELAGARRAGDAAYEGALLLERARISRARRTYLAALKQAEATVAVRLRAEGSADLAAALESGNYRPLAW